MTEEEQLTFHVLGDYNTHQGLNALAKNIHVWAVKKGFWEEQRNQGEAIALMHEELSEALRAIRTGNPPDSHVPAVSELEVELADTIIRILDFAAGFGLDLDRALQLKMLYNETRPYKHGRAF